MDFVTFEPFPENDSLPSPQPSLSIPLKTNIETLGAKLSQFNNLKQFLQLNAEPELKEEATESKLAEKYALLSLQQMSSEHKPQEIQEPEDATDRSDALPTRLSRGLNPEFGDFSMREIFTRLETCRFEVLTDLLVDAGIEGSIARQNLKSQVEAELLKNFATTIADYTRPVKSLKTLGERVSALVVSIGETRDLLEKDTKLTEELMKEIEALNCRKLSIDLKKQLLIAFRQKFTLNEYERYVLEFNDINQEFFDTLQRAEKINEDCLILLALDNPQQGHQLLAKNNEFVTKAKEKISTFCIRSLSNIYSLNNRGRLATLHMCLKYLTKSSDQLNSVLEEFIKTRSSSLVQDFAAQTNGNELSDVKHSVSDSRPVFYSSHDPVRFTADLLAYVHSIVANEVETLKNLFEGEESLSLTAAELLQTILGSLAKPIKREIDRVISAETKLQITCQIFTHLDMYHMIFSKIPEATGINKSIKNAMSLAIEKAELILSNRLATAKTSNVARLDLSSDLQPPEWIIDFYSDIYAILDASSSSTLFNLPFEEHEKLLHLLVREPIAVFDEHLSQESASFSKREVLIFKLNFLDLILSKISSIALLRSKVEELEQMILSLRREAQEFLLQELLKKCHLTDFFNVTNMIFPIDKELLDPSIYQAITENKLFTKEVILTANAEIQEVVPNALMDTQSDLIKLNNPVVVKEIITGSFEDFALFYKLFSSIVKEYLEEPFFSWSYEEVATMLGVYETGPSLFFD